MRGTFWGHTEHLAVLTQRTLTPRDVRCADGAYSTIPFCEILTLSLLSVAMRCPVRYFPVRRPVLKIRARQLLAEHEGVYMHSQLNEDKEEIELVKKIHNVEDYLVCGVRAHTLKPRLEIKWRRRLFRTRCTSNGFDSGRPAYLGAPLVLVLPC